MKRLLCLVVVCVFVQFLNIAWSADGDPVLEGKTATGNIVTTGTIQGGDVVADGSATPGITFQDSDGTDADDNGIIYGNLTDTGSGTEDFNIYLRQQVAGAMTTFMLADADGNIELGTAAQKTDVKGALVNATVTVTAAGPTDNLNVSGVNVVFIDATAATVTIGGMVGGVNGQIIRVVRLGTTNDVVLEHNEGGGSQNIFLADEADQTLSTYGGWTLVCNGTHWYEVGY